jgi:hypothetical protein
MNARQSQQRGAFRAGGKIDSSQATRTSRVRGHAVVATVYGDNTGAIYLDYLSFAAVNGNVPALARAMEVNEQWFAHGFDLEFQPTVAVTQAGMIHIAPDYDPKDLLTSDSVILAQSHGYVSGAISRPLKCKMPNFKLPSGEYIRPNLFCSPTDAERFTMFGFFNVVTTGVGSSAEMGKLILHYDISVSVPCPYNSISTVASDVDGIKSGATVPTRVMPTFATPSTHVMYLMDGAATCATNVGKTLVGQIDDLSAAGSVTDNVGRTVPKGQRVYIQPAKLTAAGAPNFTSSVLGAFNLSSTFDPRRALGLAVDAANTILSLSNVRSLEI